MFSSRTPRELEINRLTSLLEAKQAENVKLIDLTESNPTRVDFNYPQDEILAALANPRALSYQPDPRGLQYARNGVVDYYAARNITIESDRVLLTASTSEAYTLLFKLFMNPDDSVLVPVPSYPLFDHLAQIECVQPISYPLYFDGEWHIDMGELRAACRHNTRAIVIVNPNNPTGSFLKQTQLLELIELCREYNLALISDEVFGDYAFAADETRVNTVANIDEILTFALNGLSKAAGLPQLKLGWIIANGRGKLFEEALKRLEFITDLFLSVSSPVQHALPRLLTLADNIQAQLRARVAENRAWLASQFNSESICRLLPAEGGWYAIVQVPRIMPDEELALTLLQEDNILIHPGYFFDMPNDGWLVMSLINRPDIFQTGVRRLLERVHKLFSA